MFRAPESSKDYRFIDMVEISEFRFKSGRLPTDWKSIYSRNQCYEFTIVICAKEWLV